MAEASAARSSDTVVDSETRAVEGRYRGTHEVEEDCPAAEAGGPLSSFFGWSKKRGHPQFLPVCEFGEDHVRSSFPGVDRLIVDKVVRDVKSWADRVVRIRVPLISTQRPDTWAGGQAYPFAAYRGRRVNNVGSGFVSCVECRCDGGCRCGDCPLGTPDGNKYWRIVVFTARHVVYDDTEARECEVVFFNDQPDGTGSITVTGSWSVGGADTEKDVCALLCDTHDEVLVQRLKDATRRLEKQWRDSDGVRVVEWRRIDGTIEAVRDDGTRVVVRPDGKRVVVRPDGTREVVRPDGTREVVRPYGTREVVRPDGTREVVRPYGTREVVWPDGTRAV